jgi:hypothetical protein
VGCDINYLPGAVVLYHGDMNRDEKRVYNRLYRIANKDRIEARRAERQAGIGENIRRCSVPGCDAVHDAHGYCELHYGAWYRNGDPTEVRQHQIHGKTLEERLFLQVKKTDKCWEWMGLCNSKGYGYLRADNGMRLAHRVSYALVNGPIPRGLNALHRCDNPSCVRPDHLFLGTRAENNADMRAKGRQRGPSLKGTVNPNAKLTDTDVRNIRASSEMGVTLARQYGVSQTVISAVRKGRIWRHVQ